MSVMSVMSVMSQDLLHLRIQWMMGHVSKDFHDGVTHLIAGEVGSKKYIVSTHPDIHFLLCYTTEVFTNLDISLRPSLLDLLGLQNK